MTSGRRIRDIFPKDVHDCISTAAKHPETSSDFSYIQANKNVTAFTTSIQSFKIVFEQSKQDWGRLLINDFFKSGQSARQMKFFEPDRIDWGKVYRNLLRTVDRRNNTDVRTSFNWDNTFLVKAYFTFGQREVKRGTMHIYETHDAPLLLYQTNKLRNDVFYGNKSFVVENQNRYKRFILYPRRVYKLLPDTIYVLITSQKSIFTVRIVKDTARMPFEAEVPIEHTAVDDFQTLSPDTTFQLEQAPIASFQQSPVLNLSSSPQEPFNFSLDFVGLYQKLTNTRYGPPIPETQCEEQPLNLCKRDIDIDPIEIINFHESMIDDESVYSTYIYSPWPTY